MKELIAIFLFAVYIILILTVIFVERKDPTSAVLWVLVMICLPYLGAVLYIIFGNTTGIKLTSFLRKKRLKKQPVNIEESECEIDEIPLSEEDLQVMTFNHTYNNSQVSCFDNAEFFTNGRSHYTRLFKDIENAKECIYAEFYTIHHDLVGEAFVNALAKKAKEGVRVLVLCDFIANLSTPNKMFEPLVKAGGKVIRVKPYLTHFRSHRKIVVIDSKISYIGGMNIGKQYANLAKVKNPWRDTQVRLEGECTDILKGYFLDDWICSVKRRDYNDALSLIDEKEKNPKKWNDNYCQFIMGGVDTDKESIKMCYLSMIRSAKKRIFIQSPYFIPDASILDALKTALGAGVEVNLMVPGIKASFFLDPVTNYYCGQLLEYGAKVYKYNGYIHAKTMVIDSEICCIGSVNMDMRSLMVDDEVCGVFYENQFVNKYRDIFEDDIKNCKPYTWEQFNGRSRKERFSESIFLLFAPLM